MIAELSADARATLVRRGQILSRLSLAYNSLEGVASIAVGAIAGSISLIGFGVDSVIEVSSSIAALWRLRADSDPARRARVEAVTLRLIGLSFLALTLYIVVDAVHALYTKEPPEKTTPGIIIASASVVMMPLLARAKRHVGMMLGSRALTADAMQTSLCTWLSAIVLVGLGLNAMFGWWWADPVAAICMTPIIAKEGIEGLRGDEHCEECK
jgi:cation diffusion facilitator family transporter